jgi:hypothetical protein
MRAWCCVAQLTDVAASTMVRGQVPYLPDPDKWLEVFATPCSALSPPRRALAGR